MVSSPQSRFTYGGGKQSMPIGLKLKDASEFTLLLVVLPPGSLVEGRGLAHVLFFLMVSLYRGEV